MACSSSNEDAYTFLSHIVLQKTVRVTQNISLSMPAKTGGAPVAFRLNWLKYIKKIDLHFNPCDERAVPTRYL